jgi:CBS domain-containing protein
MRPITAADLMNPKVLAVRDDLKLRELAAFLIRNQITGAPVEDGSGRLVGVVSMVDIAEAVLAARGPGAGQAEDDDGGEGEGEGAGEDAGEGAGEGPREVEAGRRGAGGYLAAGDWEKEADEEDFGELGLARDDLAGVPAADLLVRDIMTPAVYSVPEDATVSEVAGRMLDSHVHRLLVLREGRPVGIVTTSDLLGLLVDE